MPAMRVFCPLARNRNLLRLQVESVATCLKGWRQALIPLSEAHCSTSYHALLRPGFVHSFHDGLSNILGQCKVTPAESVRYRQTSRPYPVVIRGR